MPSVEDRLVTLERRQGEILGLIDALKEIVKVHNTSIDGLRSAILAKQ